MRTSAGPSFCHHCMRRSCRMPHRICTAIPAIGVRRPSHGPSARSHCYRSAGGPSRGRVVRGADRAASVTARYWMDWPLYAPPALGVRQCLARQNWQHDRSRNPQRDPRPQGVDPAQRQSGCLPAPLHLGQHRVIQGRVARRGCWPVPPGSTIWPACPSTYRRCVKSNRGDPWLLPRRRVGLTAGRVDAGRCRVH